MFNRKNMDTRFKRFAFVVVVLALSSAVASCSAETESEGDPLVPIVDDLHAFVQADTSRCKDIIKAYDSMLTLKHHEDLKVSSLDKRRARHKALDEEWAKISTSIKGIKNVESLGFFGVTIGENTANLDKAHKRMLERMYKAMSKAHYESLSDVEKDQRRRHEEIAKVHDARAKNILSMKEILAKRAKK